MSGRPSIESMEHNMRELLGMGYEADQAKQALQVTQGDLSQAVAFLLMSDSSRMGFCYEPAEGDLLTSPRDHQTEKASSSSAAAAGAASSAATAAAAAHTPYAAAAAASPGHEDLARLDEQLSFTSLGDSNSDRKVPAVASRGGGDDDDDDEVDAKPKAEDTSSESVRALIQMGYNVKDSKAALDACNGDVYQAIEYLLMHGSSRKIFGTTATQSAPSSSSMLDTKIPATPRGQQLDSKQASDQYGTGKTPYENDEDAALAFALQQEEEIQMQHQTRHTGPTSTHDDHPTEDEMLAIALHHEQHEQHSHQPAPSPHYPDEDVMLAMALQQDEQEQRNKPRSLPGATSHRPDEDEMLAIALQQQEQINHDHQAQEEQRRQAERLLAAAREAQTQQQQQQQQATLLHRGQSESFPVSTTQAPQSIQQRATSSDGMMSNNVYEPYQQQYQQQYQQTQQQQQQQQQQHPGGRRLPPPVLLQQQQFRREYQTYNNQELEEQVQQGQDRVEYRPPQPPLGEDGSFSPSVTPQQEARKKKAPPPTNTIKNHNINGVASGSPSMMDDPFGFTDLGTVAMPGDPSYTSPTPTGRAKLGKKSPRASPGIARKSVFGSGQSAAVLGLGGADNCAANANANNNNNSPGTSPNAGPNKRLSSPIVVGRIFKGAGAVVGGAAKVAGAAGVGAAKVAGGAVKQVAGAGATAVVGASHAMVGAGQAVVNPSVPRMVVTNTSILTVPIPDGTQDTVSVFCAVLAASKFYQGGKVNNQFLNSIINEGVFLCAQVHQEQKANTANNNNNGNTRRPRGSESWSVLRVLITSGSDLGIAAAELDENPKQGFFLESDLNHPWGLRNVLTKCRNEQRGTDWQIVILETTSISRDCITICLPPKGSMNKFWCLDVQPRSCFRAPPGAYARAHTNLMQLVESLEGILKSIMIAGGSNRRPRQYHAFGMGDHPDGDNEPFSLYMLRKVF